MSVVTVSLHLGDRLVHEDLYNRRNGIQWTLWTQLDDLDYDDDLALRSQNDTQMRDKITLLASTSARTGLNINKGKTKIMRT